MHGRISLVRVYQYQPTAWSWTSSKTSLQLRQLCVLAVGGFWEYIAQQKRLYRNQYTFRVLMSSHGIDQVRNLKFILRYMAPGGVDIGGKYAQFRTSVSVLPWHILSLRRVSPIPLSLSQVHSHFSDCRWSLTYESNAAWRWLSGLGRPDLAHWQDDAVAAACSNYRCSSIKNQGLCTPYSSPGVTIGRGIWPWNTSMPISLRSRETGAGVSNRGFTGTTTPVSHYKSQHVILQAKGIRV